MNTKSINRKTWLGAMFTFALVAVLGLTFAFIPAKPVVEKKTQPNLYWYSISPINTLQAQLNSNPQTKDESMNGANSLTNCKDETPKVCIIGYDSEQTLGTSIPSLVANDHSIRFSK